MTTNVSTDTNVNSDTPRGTDGMRLQGVPTIAKKKWSQATANRETNLEKLPHFHTTVVLEQRKEPDFRWTRPGHHNHDAEPFIADRTSGGNTELD